MPNIHETLWHIGIRKVIENKKGGISLLDQRNRQKYIIFHPTNFTWTHSVDHRGHKPSILTLHWPKHTTLGILLLLDSITSTWNLTTPYCSSDHTCKMASLTYMKLIGCSLRQYSAEGSYNLSTKLLVVKGNISQFWEGAHHPSLWKRISCQY